MLSELPEALRRQIPPLAIAGAVYSDEPSQRMLIINNQTFGQGNVVGSGVQLEEIHSNSSIFNFQGTRFQLDH
jgi:general secretion pathway protein B